MKNLRIPHTYTIIFFIIMFMAILTWVVPSGEFHRVENADGRMIVVADSYHEVEANPQGFADFFTAPIKGIIDAADTIGFVLIVGGAFGIIAKTGAIEAGISQAVRIFGNREILLIPIAMILFALGGTTFGMCEETLPFYMIFIPLMMALGYDSLTGLSIVYIGAAVGTNASTVNPFSIGIAQAIAELAPGSGVVFRAIVWVIQVSLAIAFVIWYAKRVKKDPTKSPVYDLDQKNKERFSLNMNEMTTFRKRDGAVLAVFGIGMCVMVYGVLAYGWFTQEITMIFMIIGVFSGIAGRLNETEIAEAFVEGAKGLVYAAVVIGLARSIIIVAQDGKIIDSILFSASNVLGELPKTVFINLMLITQNIISFFVPSSSGHAALTIPIMAPLGDLVGVARQNIISAYQYGTGITSFITPTNGVLMAALTMAGIPWSKFVKYIAPLLITLWVLSAIALTIGLAIF